MSLWRIYFGSCVGKKLVKTIIDDFVVENSFCFTAERILGVN